MNLFNYKNVNRRWFSSIRVKFVVVYVLVNIIALQLIGLFFTAQLRTSNINNFEQNIIEQEKILNYHIREELDKDGKKTDNEKQAGSASTDGESIKIEGDVASANAKSGVAKLISEFNIQKLLSVSIIDSNSKIVASSSKNGNDEYLAKRSFDPLVSQVLKTGESAKKIQNNVELGSIFDGGYRKCLSRY